MFDLEEYMKAVVSNLNGDPAELEKYSNFKGQKLRIRSSIYRNSVLTSLKDSLAANYPTIEKLVGDDFFQQMAKLYFEKYPQTNRSIIDIGDKLPKFIKENEAMHNLPYLYDFAQLDRAWIESHIALNINSLSDDDIKSFLAGDHSFIFFHPSLKLVKTSYKIFDLWKKLRREEEISQFELVQESEYIYMIRAEKIVKYGSLNKIEYEFCANELAKQKDENELMQSNILEDLDKHVEEIPKFYAQEEIDIIFNKEFANIKNDFNKIKQVIIEKIIFKFLENDFLIMIDQKN